MQEHEIMPLEPNSVQFKLLETDFLNKDTRIDLAF